MDLITSLIELAVAVLGLASSLALIRRRISCRTGEDRREDRDDEEQ
ncbi:hypothetical protein ACFWY5_28255 [Nonomuraea sp. NPDC059007]